jgi:adenylate cyclase class 2
MSRGSETEIKLEVPNLAALHRRLRQIGFRKVQARHFESNTAFDFPDHRLWKARSLLRLRWADGQWLLTYKCTPLESRGYKVRREIETRVEDGEQVREILEALGLRPAFRYEKYRTTYAVKTRERQAAGPLLVLDETPVGNYLELEGPKRWIDRVAARLGYRREDYVTASYGSLYRQKCGQQGIEPTNMVFSGVKSC